MFESLTQRLSGTIERLRGRGRLTEENIRESLREVRIALLEADVALPVVQALIERIKVRAVGQEVLKSLTPGQALIKIVRDELTDGDGLGRHRSQPQRAGAGRHPDGRPAGRGQDHHRRQARQAPEGTRKKKVMVVSADVYRPAAIEQLKTLAQQVDVLFFPSERRPEARSHRARGDRRCAQVLRRRADRRHRRPHQHRRSDDGARSRRCTPRSTPVETLFVVDSMTGQDAAVTAKHFGEALPLTGVVLTKTDGDARGGAALSVRYITGKPIKFIGIGEKPDGLDVFHPDRIASRILDMGDVLSLVEQVEQQVDKDKAQKLAEKVAKGKKFDLNDMRDQLEQMQNMGGLHGLMDKLPGMGQIPDTVKSQVTGKEVPRMVAIIDSMTKKERRNPAPAERLAPRPHRQGARALTPADVNKLLKQFQQMEKMMSKLSGGGMKGLMRGMKGMMGGRGGMPFR